MTDTELAKNLRECAEWIGDNNYEVPIRLHDYLLMAADRLDKVAGICCVFVQKRLGEIEDVGATDI